MNSTLDELSGGVNGVQGPCQTRTVIWAWLPCEPGPPIVGTGETSIGRARTRRHHRSGRPAGGRLPRPQGRRPAGGRLPAGRGPVIVEGVPAVERLLASPVPGARGVRRPRPGGGPRPARTTSRCTRPTSGCCRRSSGSGSPAACWPRPTGGRRPTSTRCWPARIPRPRAGWPCSRRSTTPRTWARSPGRRSRWGSTGCCSTRAAPTRSTAGRCGSRWATSWRCRSPSCPTGRPTWAGCTTPATRPSRSPRPPTPSTSTSIDPAAHPRTAVLLGAEGPGLTPEAQAAARVRARIPMRDGRRLPRRRGRGRDRLRHPPLSGCRNGHVRHLGAQPRREKRASSARACSAWAGLHITS